MYKFLHCADIHLDSPLRNLDRYDGAPVDAFRNATRAAFDNLIELAISEKVRFVLIAGDLYDGDCRDSSTPLHFRRQMARLQGQGIRVFIIQGNHDAGMRKEFRLTLPDNVKLFSTRNPETERIEELRVAIHGQGFAEQAVEENLSENYPQPVPGWMNIGLLHTSCGKYEAHDTYAPSNVEGLTNKGYQYWALGHIHKRQILAGGRSSIVYSGNLQGRHIREDGAKSCEIVTVQDGPLTLKQHFVDVVRWQTCFVDAGQCLSPSEVTSIAMSKIDSLVADADGRPLAVRIHVEGVTAAHHQLMMYPDHWDRELRESAVDRFDDLVWIEKIKFLTKPAVELELTEDRDDAFGRLLFGIRDADAVQAIRDKLRADIELLLKTVPTDPRLTEDRLDPDNDRQLSQLVGDIKQLLVGKLLESEEPT